MTTSSCTELLQVALEDLRLARRTTANRLPENALSVVDEATRSMFNALAATALSEEEALSGMIHVGEGDPNLWAGGILDDASRDVRSSAGGPVRDIALIDAVRKLIAADAVSLDTAIALTKGVDEQQAPALEKMHSAALAFDAQLCLRLGALVCVGASRRLD